MHRVDPAGGGASRDAAAAARPGHRRRVPSPCPRPSTFPTDDGRTASRAVLPADHPEQTGPDGELPPLLVDDPRRPDGRGVAGVLDGRAVLDEPRLRRRRRQLRRLDGLRPRLPRRAARAAGASSTSTTAVAAARHLARTRPGRRRAAVPSGRLGRRVHHPRVRSPFADTPSRRAPTTTASPTSRRSPGTRTSSRAATSTGSSAPTRPREDVYVERSPIHHVDGLTRPLIVLQGLEDAIVPPTSRETIVDALRAKRRARRLPRSSTASSTASGGPRTSAGAGRRAVVLRPGARASPLPRGRGHRAGGRREPVPAPVRAAPASTAVGTSTTGGAAERRPRARRRCTSSASLPRP